jgi:hypothetical protein
MLVSTTSLMATGVAGRRGLLIHPGSSGRSQAQPPRPHVGRPSCPAHCDLGGRTAEGTRPRLVPDALW